MKRRALVLGQIWQKNLGAFCGRQLFFHLLRRVPEALHGRKVSGQVHMLLRLEFFYHPVDDSLVKIIAAQMIVPGCSQHFDDALSNLDHRHVESAAAQIIYHNLLGLAVVESIRKSRAGGLVDDSFYFQTCDPAGVLCGLPLYIIKIRGHGNHRFCHRLSQEILRVFLKLHQNHGADSLGIVFRSVNADAPLRSHMPFYRTDGALRIRHCLPAGGFSYQPFSVPGKGYHARRRRSAGRGRDNHRLIVLHHGDAAVRRTQINTNYLAHLFVTPVSKINLFPLAAVWSTAAFFLHSAIIVYHSSLKWSVNRFYTFLILFKVFLPHSRTKNCSSVPARHFTCFLSLPAGGSVPTGPAPKASAEAPRPRQAAGRFLSG